MNNVAAIIWDKVDVVVDNGINESINNSMERGLTYEVWKATRDSGEDIILASVRKLIDETAFGKDKI